MFLRKLRHKEDPNYLLRLEQRIQTLEAEVHWGKYIEEGTGDSILTPEVYGRVRRDDVIRLILKRLHVAVYVEATPAKEEVKLKEAPWLYQEEKAQRSIDTSLGTTVRTNIEDRIPVVIADALLTLTQLLKSTNAKPKTTARRKKTKPNATKKKMR